MERRYRRGVSARRDQIVLGAVAAAVLIAIVALAAAGGGVERATVTPTPAPAERGDRPLFGGSLEPGVRYRTRAFIPALSFSVADTEWIVDDATQPDRLVLERRIRTRAPGSELPPRSYLAFSRISVVVDPRPGDRADLAVADLYAWMRRHPDLVVGPRTAATVGGVPGDRFHVAVRFSRPARAAGACRPLLLVCTSITPDRYFEDGTQMSTIVLRTEPDPVVIDVVGLTKRDLDAIDAPAARVLRTLRIGVR
jgi:hypothetical protein